MVELGLRAERLAALRRVGRAGGAIAVDEDVVALALDVEVRQRELQALAAIGSEVDAELREHVVGLGVGDRAAGVETDATAVAVVGHAAIDMRDRDQRVVLLGLPRERRADLPHRAVVVELRSVARGECVLVADLGGRLRDVVDDAARRADAFGRGRTVDHLDAADDAHVGEGRVAGAFAQRRALRDAVEETQRDAAAQVLTGIGQRLRRLGVARHRAREDRGRVLGLEQRVLDLLGRDHRHRAGDLVDRLRIALTGRDRDLLEALGIIGARRRRTRGRRRRGRLRDQVGPDLLGRRLRIGRRRGRCLLRVGRGDGSADEQQR